MKQFTDITVLLDRSGSMGSIREAMEAAFNDFIKKHSEVPSTKLTLIQFDGISHDTVYQAVPIGAVEKLRLHPRDQTPLLDSMCKAIDATGSRLAAMDESDRPDQVLMVIITDGQENASRTYTRKDVFKRVTTQRDRYNWAFVYLGANQDTFAESQSLGFNWSNVLKYTHDHNHALLAMGALSSHTHSYVVNSANTRGATAGLTFDNTTRTVSATKEDLDKDSNS